MASQDSTYVAFLRGINVGGKNKIPMAPLRELVAAHGCENVDSYIQSGNLIFTSAENAVALELAIEKAITLEFGLSIPVIVRDADAWSHYLTANPFAKESAETPNWVQLLLSKDKPKPDAADAMQARATRDERIVMVGDALFAHFPKGIGPSKLTPAVMDRCTDSIVTARNWKTVLQMKQRIDNRAAK